jgi:hypothetical protein
MSFVALSKDDEPFRFHQKLLCRWIGAFAKLIDAMGPGEHRIRVRKRHARE